MPNDRNGYDPHQPRNAGEALIALGEIRAWLLTCITAKMGLDASQVAQLETAVTNCATQLAAAVSGPEPGPAVRMSPPDRVMTADEIVVQIERWSRARGFASAADLVAQYHDGTLAEPGAVLDILGLAFMLPRSHALHVALDAPRAKGPR